MGRSDPRRAGREPSSIGTAMATEPTTDPVTEPLVRISDRAREKLISLRLQDPENERLALWLAVAGVRDGRYVYDMTFRYLTDAAEGDAVQEEDGLTVIVPGSSVGKLRGASIDAEPPQGRLTIDNPNRPSAVGMALPVVPKPAPGGGFGGQGAHAGHAHAGHAHAGAEAPASPAVGAHATGDLSGDVAQRVAQVLDMAINPSIASHGGRAELVAVEDDTAFLRLSGGCQGCGMASVTLTQGIRVAITEAVPEIANVVDVTDHASGTNPYFEPAKK
ncbi:MAG: NifU family protein [Actinobacteria bacterium]|nr:NifU family protein [Actinomycetota bacterium]